MARHGANYALSSVLTNFVPLKRHDFGTLALREQNSCHCEACYTQVIISSDVQRAVVNATLCPAYSITCNGRSGLPVTVNYVSDTDFTGATGKMSQQ